VTPISLDNMFWGGVGAAMAAMARHVAWFYCLPFAKWTEKRISERITTLTAKKAVNALIKHPQSVDLIRQLLAYAEKVPAASSAFVPSGADVVGASGATTNEIPSAPATPNPPAPPQN